MISERKRFVAIMNILILLFVLYVRYNEAKILCYTCDSRDVDEPSRANESRFCDDNVFVPTAKMLTVCDHDTCVVIKVASASSGHNFTKRYCSIMGITTCKEMKDHFTEQEDVDSDDFQCSVCSTQFCNAPSPYDKKCTIDACLPNTTPAYIGAFKGLALFGAVVCAVEMIFICIIIIVWLFRFFPDLKKAPEVLVTEVPQTIKQNVHFRTVLATEFHRSCSQLRALHRADHFLTGTERISFVK